ncbi:YgjV family protein, partial [Escherichia coli]|nr:YgjV family protein [Escherichia coli]
GYVFLPVVMIIGVLTYSGLPTILMVTACSLIMIGRLQSDTLWMRGIQLTASPFGATHDVVVGAWPCLAGAVVSFTIAATAFRRELRSRHQRGQIA